jgi:hypothetical protein
MPDACGSGLGDNRRREVGMKPKTLYLFLCVAGAVLPYSLFVPFLLENGLDPRLIVDQLFANRISGSFALDVIVSSIVFWVFVFVEGRRAGVARLWVPIAANLVVGLSLGLPLFLYMRERRLEEKGQTRVS